MRLTTRFAKRRAAGMIVSIVLGILVAALHPRFDGLERLTWDMRFAHRGVRPSSERVALVAIDDKTYDYPKWQAEPSITWGPHYADAIRNLHRAGAVVVGWDMLQRGSTEDLARKLGVEVTFDQQFAQALAEVGNVILVVIRRSDPRWQEPTKQLLYANGIKNVGAANFKQGAEADPDGVVRGFLPIWQGGTRVSSFGLRMVERSVEQRATYDGPRRLKLGDVTMPIHRDGTLLINYRGPVGTIPRYSLCDVAENELPQGVTWDQFRDKIVVVGETFTGTQDVHLTPYSRGAPANVQHMPGAEIWANAVDALLSRRFLSATEVPTGQVILFLLAVVTGVIFLAAPQAYGALACGVLLLGWYGACEWAFRAHDHLLLMFAPMCLIPANYSAIIAYRFFSEEREKKQITGMWSRYCSKAVVDYLLKYPEEQARGGRRTRVTVLFSDIRGFTALSDDMDATQVVSRLNEYFSAMTDIVVKNGGIVDKYIGDAIMAVWGAPVPCRYGPALAVYTAVKMQAALEDLNKRWEAESAAGKAPEAGRAQTEGPAAGPAGDNTPGKRPENVQLKIGVGINTGDAASGVIGSEHKVDFTVIGDTVNMASRFETLTKDLELEKGILIGEETSKQLEEWFEMQRMLDVAVKGKRELVVVYAVRGLKPGAEAKLLEFRRCLPGSDPDAKSREPAN